MTGKEWYQQQRMTPEWIAKSKEIRIRDNYTCVQCKKTGVLIDCNHKYYVKGMRPWEYPSYALEILCRDCHYKRYTTKPLKFETHEEAEEWIMFADADAQMIEDHLKEREERIRYLNDNDAVWEREGRYWCFVDEHGKDRFFDEDGNEMG